MITAEIARNVADDFNDSLDERRFASVVERIGERAKSGMMWCDVCLPDLTPEAEAELKAAGFKLETVEVNSWADRSKHKRIRISW